MGTYQITNWKSKGVPRGEGDKLGFPCGAVDDTWLNVNTPCSVQQMLINQKIIADPRYAPDPDGILAPISGQEWWFVSPLPQTEASEKAFLSFEGLNVHARVWINGVAIAETNNMFIGHQFEITEYLQATGNMVVVCLDRGSLESPAPDYLWGLFNTERLYCRKMQMDWGWDFVPFIGSLGIWRPVILKTGAPEMIRDLYVRTLSIADEVATVEIRAELTGWIRGDRVEFKIGGQQQAVAANDCVRTVLHIESPRLWWPHDIGEPYLYELQVSMRREALIVAAKTMEVGIRTVQIVQQPLGKEGLSFCFHLNNRPIYCKGANWVPVDVFPGEGRERYEKLLSMARDCNMNMLRVWGGGIYEDDSFYTQCDRLGILIWQDFAYTCGSYPDDAEEFCARVREEAIWVVKTLRRHPSIVLWCGNNECDWKYATRHWDRPGHTYFGFKIFHQILPAVCAALDEDRPYWPSSPYGGPEPNSRLAGDTHNWHVWHGLTQARRYWEKPNIIADSETGYRAYLQDDGKFISEFGIQGSPALATLTKYWGPVKMPLLIQKQNKADAERHRRLMEIHLGETENPEDYCLRSMMMQAEGLKLGVEHFRRRKFNCSGCLIWQFNDSWPAFSWSLVDYDGIPKAAYFYVRRAYAPQILSWQVVEDKAVLWGINDTDQDWNGPVYFGWQSLNGQQQYNEEIEAAIPGNSSVSLCEFSLESIPDRASIILRANAAKGRLAEAVEFLVDPKSLRLEEPKISITQEGSFVRIRADRFVSFFHFPGAGTDISDNYFNLLPGSEYLIQGTIGSIDDYHYYRPHKKGN